MRIDKEIIMRRKVFTIIIAIFLLVTVSCSYRRSIPPNNSPVPKQDEKQAKVKTPQQKQPDKLAKSNKNSIEENINGIEINSDKKLTDTAESQGATQISVGVNQDEAVKINGTADNISSSNVLQQFQTKLPSEIQYGVQYNRYDLSYDYFLITNEKEVTIYKTPDPNDTIVCKAYSGEKLALHQKVSGKALGNSDVWYKVSCKMNGAINIGYIHSANGLVRTFSFDKMLAGLQALQKEISKGKLHFISNYKNVNGAPPSKNGAAVDQYGMRIYQSAPGYVQADTNSDFRYIPDGMLVRILDETDAFYRVHAITFDKELFVPKKYIDPNVTLNQLSNVVIVDRNQQNQASFKISSSSIVLTSYTLATTGLKGNTSFETPLGYYKTIEKKERFQYLKDGTSEIAGYAPFAIRFSGGAYIHGVPVTYEDKNGEKIDPGIKEYLQTIGTFPRSHMCVRNFSSHAEFLYNWINIDNGAIIVIE